MRVVNRVINKVFVLTDTNGVLRKKLSLSLNQKVTQVTTIDVIDNRLKENAALIEYQLLVSLSETYNTDFSIINKLPDLIIQQFATMGAFINAGVRQFFVNVTELKYSPIDRNLNINIKGIVYISKTFLPHLSESHLTN